MEFHISFHTVTLCLPVCLVCFANDRGMPFSETPDVPRYLILPYGLRSQRFRWFLIGMGVTCRDSNTSLHKRGKIPDNFLCE